MGRFWDEFKMAMRDQAVGSMKYGASMSISHNAAAMKAAREERLAEESRRDQQSARLGQYATRAAQTGDQIYAYLKDSGQLSSNSTMFEDDGFKVQVKRDYSKQRKCHTISMIIIDKNVRDMHIHAVYESETGRRVFCEWRNNH